MKRLVLAAIALLVPAAASAATSYERNTFFFKPYLGAQYEYSHMQYEEIPGTGLDGGNVFDSNFHGGNIHVGARVHRNLGIELGYMRTLTADKDNILGSPLGTSTRLQGGTLDAMGYFPIENTPVELMGSIGVGYMQNKAGLNAFGISVSDTDDEFQPRFGAGAQFWLTENLNLRTMVNYQKVDFEGLGENIVTGTIGVNWEF